MDLGLDQICTTADRFVVDVAVAVGVLPPVLMTLPYPESSLAYYDGSLIFDEYRTFSQNLLHFSSVHLAATSGEEPGRVMLHQHGYFSTI